MYSLIPAAVNPVIYCLKTKDIKEALIQRYKNRKASVAIKVDNKVFSNILLQVKVPWKAMSKHRHTVYLYQQLDDIFKLIFPQICEMQDQ